MRPPVIAENSIRSENTGVPIIREIMVATTMTMRSPYGEKTRPGPCPEPELIALRTLMINQARQRFCKWRFPASLIYVLKVSPIARCPVGLLCRFPFVILQQAAQSFSTPHCSDVPSCLRPRRKQDPIAFALMVVAPRGNVRYIAATLAAATILQPGSASTDILL